MDQFPIKKLELEKQLLIERLMKVDNAIKLIRELFPEPQPSLNESNGVQSSKSIEKDDYVDQASGFVWDNKPNTFRKNVYNLLVHLNRYTKVGELTDYIYKHDKTLPKNLLQEKVSRTLTGMRKISHLETIKVHPGSSGVAWGFSGWRNGDFIPDEHRYVDTNGQEMLFSK